MERLQPKRPRVGAVDSVVVDCSDHREPCLGQNAVNRGWKGSYILNVDEIRAYGSEAIPKLGGQSGLMVVEMATPGQGRGRPWVDERRAGAASSDRLRQRGEESIAALSDGEKGLKLTFFFQGPCEATEVGRGTSWNPRSVVNVEDSHRQEKDSETPA